MITHIVRPLEAAERRTLEAQVAGLERDRPRLRRAFLVSGLVVTVALWFLTILASDSDWRVITAFWAAVGGAIAVWAWRGQARDLSRRVDIVRSALRRNEVDVVRIQSQAVVEFEEVDDEGGCFAFQTEDDQIVFIIGQAFYPDERFPNSDFSVLTVLGRGGMIADLWVSKGGSKLEPLRRIDAAARRRLQLPECFEIRHGRLDELKRILAE